ncbi:MAG TPA: phosphatase PAP2 family protein [Nitrososphaerales archaeon]|nr:phosphatase PAP2 family protein [Nitrososphaerales archaeon]
MQKKTILRYSLITLSVLLGVVIRFWNFDSYEVQYVAAIQQAALAANLMWFFQLYSHLGDSIVWIGVALLLFAFYYKRPRRPLKFALFLIVVSVVVIAMRLAFPRSRPFQSFPSSVQDFAFEGIPSYPSGHITPTAGGLYLLANHNKKLNILFGALVVLLAVSRVATGTHFITDVVGAALLSYPIAAIIDDMKLFERFKDS